MQSGWMARDTYTVLCGNSEGARSRGRMRIDGRTILKWIIKKYGRKVQR
jgi:hypothetical protein